MNQSSIRIRIRVRIHPSLTGILGIALGFLFSAPAPLHGGANSWTGGPPPGTVIDQNARVAVAPSDANVVYAAYDQDLERSDDAGRTWTRVASFDSLRAIAIDPTAADTVNVGAERDGLIGIFQSRDGGVTWTRTLPGSFLMVSFAASHPGSGGPSTVVATDSGSIYRSVDGGASWTPAQAPHKPNTSLTPLIASLLFDPAGDALYAEGDDYDYFSSYTPLKAFVRKSTDAGDTWTDLSSGLAPSASAICAAFDPANPANLFAGLMGSSASDVYRSTDGGASWSADGLPALTVESLARDAQGHLFAGTSLGIYHSGDSGTTWAPFGQQLANASVDSLALEPGERTLHAATSLGYFAIDLREGAIDVAAGDGTVRLLSWNGDRLSVVTSPDAGAPSSSPAEGPFFGWTATAIAQGDDALSRVLWVHGDGRAGLEIAGDAGDIQAFRFPAIRDWTATDVAVASDLTADILWTGATGGMFVTNVDSTGNATPGPTYGPYPGWAPIAMADSHAGDSWVLWRAADGRTGLSRHRAGVVEATFRVPATPGWFAQDIAVGTDDRPRVLRVSADGRAEISTLDANGEIESIQILLDSGFEARRISAGPDGLTRLLWNTPDGSSDVWPLNADNSHRAPDEPSGIAGTGIRTPVTIHLHR